MQNNDTACDNIRFKEQIDCSRVRMYCPFFIRSTSEWLQNKTIPWAIEWLDTGEMAHTFVDVWNKHS